MRREYNEHHVCHHLTTHGIRHVNTFIRPPPSHSQLKPAHSHLPDNPSDDFPTISQKYRLRSHETYIVQKSRLNSTTHANHHTTQHPISSHLITGKKYSDAAQLKTALDEELKTLDSHHSIKSFGSDFQPPAQFIIPLVKLYRYKRVTERSILPRKFRFNLRGNSMEPWLHDDPKHTKKYNANRTTQPMLIALQTTLNLTLEHLDITVTYLHEQYQHKNPVYASQIPTFHGKHKHPGPYTQLDGNIYGAPQGAYYCNRGIHQFLKSLGYRRSEHHNCFHTLKKKTGIIMVGTKSMAPLSSPHITLS